MNNFISGGGSAVQFNHFDVAVNLVVELGKGALLAKVDVKSAFRICPVSPLDWHYLGFTFADLWFVDLCLPFGMRSSVNRFTQLASSLLWIMQNNYDITDITHYLDDYFLAGPPKSQICGRNMQTTVDLFRHLGVPLAPEKMEGPTTKLTYLGIEIDTDLMELRLPPKKLESLMSTIRNFTSKKKCTKCELLSLIGQLSFAAKIIPAGRTFTRRLIDLSTTVARLSHHITLNSTAREDINWLVTFLPSWNGKYKILPSCQTMCPDMNLFTDASGALGFGIFFNGKWIAASWPNWAQNRSIQWKEPFPIYLA